MILNTCICASVNLKKYASIPTIKMEDYRTSEQIVAASKKYQSFLDSRRNDESRKVVSLIMSALLSKDESGDLWMRSKDLFDLFLENKIKCNTTTFYRILDDMETQGFIVRKEVDKYTGKGKNPVFYKINNDYSVFLTHPELVDSVHSLMHQFLFCLRKIGLAVELLEAEGYSNISKELDEIIAKLDAETTSPLDVGQFFDLDKWDHLWDEYKVELMHKAARNRDPNRRHPKKKKD